MGEDAHSYASLPANTGLGKQDFADNFRDIDIQDLEPHKRSAAILRENTEMEREKKIRHLLWGLWDELVVKPVREQLATRSVSKESLFLEKAFVGQGRLISDNIMTLDKLSEVEPFLCGDPNLAKDNWPPKSVKALLSIFSELPKSKSSSNAIDIPSSDQ